jgi:hypothetical protein
MANETSSSERVWCKVCEAIVDSETKQGQATLAGPWIGALGGALIAQLLRRSLIHTISMAALGGVIGKRIEARARLLCAECGTPVRRGEKAPAERSGSARSDQEARTGEARIGEGRPRFSEGLKDLGVERHPNF